MPPRQRELFTAALTTLANARTRPRQPRDKNAVRDRMLFAIQQSRFLLPSAQAALLECMAPAMPPLPASARAHVERAIAAQAATLPAAQQARVLQALVHAIGPVDRSQLHRLQPAAELTGRLPAGEQTARLRAEIVVASEAADAIVTKLHLPTDSQRAFKALQAMHAERQPSRQYAVLRVMPREIAALPAAERLPALIDTANRSTALEPAQRSVILGRLSGALTALATQAERQQAHEHVRQVGATR